MTDRRPPSLGTYRPEPDDGPDRRRAAPDRTQWTDPASPAQTARAPAPPDETGENMPRILTARVRDDGGQSAAPRTRTKGQAQTRRPPPPPERDGMGVGRVILYSLLGLVVFVVAAGAAAFVLVPTDVIRNRVAAEVKARTGRDLDIAERPSLTLWPRPAVTLRKVTLSAPAAMGGAPLLKVEEIDVAVKILPLLLHDISIDTLILKKPVVDLQVDAQGRRSWDFAAAENLQAPIRLAQATTSGKNLPKELQDFVKGASDGQSGAQGQAGGARGSRISDITLANVGIVDGTVRYRDARSGIDETVTALNATLALANIASPLETKADLVWRGEPVAVTAQLAPFRALVEGRPIQAQIKASGAPLTARFEGTVATQPDLDLDGRIFADAPSLEKLARWTGRPLAAGLAGGLSIEGKLRQSAQIIAFNDTRLKIGPLSGSGTASIDTRGARPFLKGAMHVAVVDLNVLKAAAGTAASPVAAGKTVPAQASPKSIEDLLRVAPDAAPPAKGTVKPQVRGYTKRDGWSDEPIDVSALGLLDADVKLGFDKVLWQELATGAGQIGFSLKSKVAKVSLEDIQLYNGRARGIITIDANAAEPTIGGNLVADGVSALPMLKALSDFDWISGRARIAIAVAGRGATERQLISTLNGKTDIAVTDGALVGYNFAQMIKGIGLGRLPSFERQPNEKTEFSEFAASAQIANGIARNTDLRVTSPQLTATGAGTIDLPQRTIDYVLKPKVQPNLEVPLKIVGSLDKPTVTPDVAGLLRDPNAALQAIQDAAKTPGGREVQDTVKGLLNGDPNARAKAKGFLDQFLKQ